MTAETPDVSVIIAVRNGGGTLRSCLDSVVAQKGCRVELIVIDALSDDETPAIVAAFSDSVTHHVRESDAGISDAWNKGVALAAGRWCAFLGADDTFADEFVLAEMVAIGRRADDVVLVYGDVRVVGGPYDYVLSVDEADVEQRLRRASMIPHPGAIHRVTAVRAAGGFDPTFRIAGDLDLVQRLARHGHITRFGHTVVDMHVGGLSTRPSQQLRRHRERYWILTGSAGHLAAASRISVDIAALAVGRATEGMLVRALGPDRGRRAANRLRTCARRPPR